MQSSSIGKFLKFGDSRRAASGPHRCEPRVNPQSDAQTASPVVAARAESEPLPAHSIFHERWWLDIATDGNWQAATVRRSNEIVAEMPYAIRKKGLWRTSQMPPLTRTLGPAFRPGAADPARAMLDRLSIAEELIAQIPEVDSFYQILDPRIEDALAFGLNGYTITTRYTLQFSPERSVEELWKALNGKTRNLIRTGQKFLRVARIDSPAEFNRFYEGNLAVRSRSNVYGAHVMQRLVDAFVERNAGYLLGAYDANGKLVAAIGVTFDTHAAYYLLSSRVPGAHAGAISVLVWHAIQDALQRKLTFDFDGIPNANTFRFLCGFRPTLKPRLVIERHKSIWSMLKAGRRVLLPKKSEWFVSTA
ncbi:GNAT family N-acetyltransferase [Caballeronia insecticola]|uniref:BioF2-like acetyltransferase domain-containing protein n=1 Tax=Caballeronia insecticola TaxID=758793 RepID=R4X2L8_9BURK|nr:GNAT family N-acetyltransferase [Caballeronia insecticola]BAN26781.1 putative uncharacterized protein [Caballeronia insecticola]